METYNESMSNPNAMDGYHNFIGNVDDIKPFLILLSKNRDSHILDESNFDCALESLGGESETVQVHRFGHWACGWFEYILIDPKDKKAVIIAEGIESALSDYPVLNDSDYSDRCFNDICEYWVNMSLSERIEYCKDNDTSIFSARFESIPELVYDDLSQCDSFY